VVPDDSRVREPAACLPLKELLRVSFWLEQTPVGGASPLPELCWRREDRTP
jgi:hypothetical protein